MASQNIRGVMNAVERKDIANFMDNIQIDIMTVQETHNGEATRETHVRNTLGSFSGGDTTGAIYHGVGIVIRTN